MEDKSLIFHCECCGRKRCCNIEEHKRTCARCHLWSVMCQSEIDCKPIIEGKCEVCAGCIEQAVIRDVNLSVVPVAAF